MRRTLASVAALVVLASSEPAEACKCVEMPLERELAQTALVFEGEVVALRGVEEQELPGAAPPVAVARVVRSWKKAREGAIVEIHGFAESCGFPLTTLGRYLVFASQASDGMIETTSCTRTRKWADAQTEVTALDALLAAPDAATMGRAEPAPSPSRGGCASCSAAGSESAVPFEPFVLAIALALRRRRRAESRDGQRRLLSPAE